MAALPKRGKNLIRPAGIERRFHDSPKVETKVISLNNHDTNLLFLYHPIFTITPTIITTVNGRESDGEFKERREKIKEGRRHILTRSKEAAIARHV